MTDALIKAAKNDQQIIAVLAHEMGHIEYQHGLREAVTNNIPSSLVFLSLLGSSQSAHRMTMLLLRRAKEK